MRAALQKDALQSIRRRVAERWLIFLAISLLGYAVIGRGYAYAGYPPIFVGEILLLIGLVAFVMTPGWMRVMRMAAALLHRDFERVDSLQQQRAACRSGPEERDRRRTTPAAHRASGRRATVG